MVEFTIIAKQFKLINRLINESRDNYILNFTSTGIDIKAVDMSNTWMCKIHIPKTSMKSYDYNEDDTIKKVGVDASNILRILSNELLHFGDLITIDKAGYINCGIVKKKISSYDTELKYPSKEPRVPNLELYNQCNFRISIKSLYDCIVLCDDHTRFNYIKNEVTVSNDDVDDNTIIDINKIIDIINVEHSEDDFNTLITNDIILDVLKICKPYVMNVDVLFGKDYPVTYNFIDEWGTEYMILQAPRIEST